MCGFHKREILIKFMLSSIDANNFYKNRCHWKYYFSIKHLPVVKSRTKMKYICSFVIICVIALAQISVIKGGELNDAFLKCVMNQIDEVLPIGSLPKEWEDYRVSFKKVAEKSANNEPLRYVLVNLDSLQINISWQVISSQSIKIQ